MRLIWIPHYKKRSKTLGFVTVAIAEALPREPKLFLPEFMPRDAGTKRQEPVVSTEQAGAKILLLGWDRSSNLFAGLKTLRHCLFPPPLVNGLEII